MSEPGPTSRQERRAPAEHQDMDTLLADPHDEVLVATVTTFLAASSALDDDFPPFWD